MLELFTLQLTVLLNRSSFLDFNPYLSKENEASFESESKFWSNICHWTITCVCRCYQVLPICCGFYYIYYFSFSAQSIGLSIFAVFIQVINTQFCCDDLMFNWLSFLSIRRLSYSIASLFSNNDSASITLDLKKCNQVWQQCKLLNQLSQTLNTMWFIFGVIDNTPLILAVYSLTQMGQEMLLLLILLVSTGVLTVVILRLSLLVVASTPLHQANLMRDRVRFILLYNKDISWKDRRSLLNVIKSQESLKTKFGLTTIDGRLLEKNLLGHHIVYSVRVLVLLLKFIKL